MNNFTKRRIAFAVAAIGYVSAMVPAYAADDAVTAAPATSTDASKLERVEVVGSNIKRAVSTQSTQIENYKTEDFAKKGLTSAQDVINSLASNQSSVVAASSVGLDTGGAAYANLRSLGSQYTLVLIDGRRVANMPGGSAGYAVDLNAIPMDAIERVEVLKDGASAIYGTDAIGGVINFITKKNYQGASASINYATPTQSGGGVDKSISVAGGIGDLDSQGWNLQGSFGYTTTSELTNMSRKDVAVDRNTTWSSSTWPANYVGSDGVYNPAAPNGCRGGSTNGQRCYENTNAWVSALPESERWTYSGKATKRVLADSELSLQVLHSENRSMVTMAPTPMGGENILLNSSSPYYPTVNSDGTTNDGSPLTLYGRTVDAGARKEQYRSSMTRIQSNLEGTVAGWDYRAGLGFSQSDSKETLSSGWINSGLLQEYLDNGTLNPFGSNPATVWDSLKLSGWLNKSKLKQWTADYKMSKEVLALPAGNLAVAWGSEIRREDMDFKVNRDVADNAMSSGATDSQDTSGGRTVYAFYGEAIIPILKWLEADTAVRYDHYSDFGDTVNPKISIKATPIKEVMFRGSASTGFRAPTMYDMYSPKYVTYTSNDWIDTRGCAAGVAGTCGKDNAQQQHIRYGGNTGLQAEKSFSTSIGTVVQPVRNVMASADLWTTLIRNQIGVLSDTALFSSSKYDSNFVTKSNGALDYVDDPTVNLGGVRTSGVDLAAFWRIPTQSYGVFTLGANSTYTRRYDYQIEKDGAYKQGVGRYSDGSVVFRWKTNTTLSWQRAEWGATLGSNYMSGYTDANADDEGHRVQSYLTWDGSVTYTWNKQATFTLGSRNMFNKKPLYSNQGGTFQSGYDPRYTDILGRVVFLNMTYKM